MDPDNELFLMELDNSQVTNYIDTGLDEMMEAGFYGSKGGRNNMLE